MKTGWENAPCGVTGGSAELYQIAGKKYRVSDTNSTVLLDALLLQHQFAYNIL